MHKEYQARQRRFIQCDVFTSHPTKGNALAVVLDAEGLSEEQMQTFAAWTNLAETTFLLPPSSPDADYHVRIFTTAREMLFAGHPTLGTCASWLRSGGVPQTPGLVKQECGVGIVEIDINQDMPAFLAPPTSIDQMAEPLKNSIVKKLGLNPDDVVRSAVLNNGPKWHALELRSAEAVLKVDSSLVRWPNDNAIGLIGPHAEGGECDFEVRMLAPSSGMSEDPITGSLNSAIAHWRQANSLLDHPYIVAQGTCINRTGRVYVSPGREEGQAYIGGQTHILIEGTLLL
jgi:PhzF family phenazine biosynthesis protein